VVTGAEQGPWRTDRVPYLKDVMDAYIDPEVEEITITGPAQCAKTEAVINMMLYSIDCDPVPCLYITDTDANSNYISDDRLEPTILGTPATARHVTGRPWDMSSKEKRLNRMSIYFGSSQSVSSLVSKAIGRLFVDETDKYKYTVGREGNPIRMAMRRGQTFQAAGYFKVVYLCTPTTEDGFINQSYEKSNKLQYFTPCPRCGEFIRMEFGQLKVEPAKMRDADIIRKKECVYYECRLCGGRIEQYERFDMTDAGVWVPEGLKIDAGGDYILFDAKGRRVMASGRPKRGRRHVGFWIGEMISPWIPWHEMTAEWFEKNTPEGIALGELREFKNQVLAQVWTEEAIDIERHKLAEHIGDFSKATVPSDCKVLIGSADYHKGHAGNITIVYEVRGFGYEGRNWVVSSGSLTSWEAFENVVLNAPWEWSDPDKTDKNLTVRIVFVDASFGSPDVFDFCLRHPGRCCPVRGKQYQRSPVIATGLEKTAHKRFQNRGLILYWVDTTFFKNQVTGWAAAEPGDKRQTEYYAEIPDTYFTEFTNEHRVKERDKKTGQVKFVWRPVVGGRPTHHLDTAVYAAAAAFHLGVYRMRPPRPTTKGPQKPKTKRKIRTKY